MTYIFLSNAEIVELAQKIVGKWDTIMETSVISPDFTVEDIGSGNRLMNGQEI